MSMPVVDVNVDVDVDVDVDVNAAMLTPEILTPDIWP